MRPRRNANGPGGGDLVIDRPQNQVAIEYLDSPVTPVCDVDIALSVGRDRVRRVELIGLRSARSNGFDESSVLVVLDHARIAVAIGDVYISSSVPSHIGRPVEYVRPRFRRRSSGPF